MTNRRVRIVLQARTNSGRLPCKSLLPIGGMPLAVFCAKRLGSTGIDVVLATSKDSMDDLLAQTAEKYGVKIFRGSLMDVLDRYVKCVADLNDEDIIVRATADNPVPNGNFIDILVQKFIEAGGDYFGTLSPVDGLPYGLSAEVISVRGLRLSSREAIEVTDRENVTAWLRQRVGVVGVARQGTFLDGDFTSLRCTIDTLDDYLSMASIFFGIEKSVEIDWRTIIPMLPASGSTSSVKRLDEKTIGKIMLGTAQFGMADGIANRSGKPNDAEISSILETATKAGINYLNTGRTYGDSESKIGLLLPFAAKFTVKIATKLLPMDNLPDDATEREIKSTLNSSIYGSCRDLRRDTIDILLFNRSADIYRWNGAALSLMEDHIAQGVVHALGVSVYSPDEAVKCLAEKWITHLQIPFNLLDSRWVDGNFLEVLFRRPDVSVHVRSVFLQGLLINPGEIWPSWFGRGPEFVRRIEELANEFGRKGVADLCLAYVRSFPWVATLALGVETKAQLDELLSIVCEPPLTKEQALKVRASFSDIPPRLLDPSQW